MFQHDGGWCPSTTTSSLLETQAGGFVHPSPPLSLVLTRRRVISIHHHPSLAWNASWRVHLPTTISPLPEMQAEGFIYPPPPLPCLKSKLEGDVYPPPPLSHVSMWWRVIVRGLTLPLLKSLLPLGLASAVSCFRPIFQSFRKTLWLPHIVFRSALSWVTAGRLPKVICFCLYFHYGVIPSRHLLSYSHGAILLFYLFFHHPTLVYISSLPDRKVPILLSLDFLPGVVYDLYYLVVCLYLFLPASAN